MEWRNWHGRVQSTPYYGANRNTMWAIVTQQFAMQDGLRKLKPPKFNNANSERANESQA